MILCYAMGGGLGHLMRASAFISMNKFRKFRIITASPFATRIFEPSRLIMIPREFERHPELLSQFMQDVLDYNRPEIFIIDTFSHGILGELNGLNFEKSRIFYITRRLKWKRYLPKAGSKIDINKTFILEPPEPEHLEYIIRTSDEVIDYDLQYPEHEIDINNRLAVNNGQEKWFVVHSGPAGEITRLISFARQKAATMNVLPELLVISQVKPVAEHTWWSKTCPAHGYFQFASRLITACGFNVMKQAGVLDIPHDFLPFDRKYDDQFWRAAQAKKNEPF